ncbi:MAG: HAD hydrolase family protein [Cellvibrionaceae bacterium]|nr:HAD hydrolase family protein [Cellvibrionaceae bacterium]
MSDATLFEDPTLLKKARAIRLLVLDVDGVLTDGRLYYGAQGEALKVFNTLDGHGIKMLQRAGVKVAIITGRRGEALLARARDLGIDWIQQGREDKFVALQEMLAAEPIPLDEIACMGDDWPDLAVMTRVGLSLTVANAHPEVKARAHWLSQNRGGEGAVREACDLLLRAQNHFQQILGEYAARD